MPIFNNYSDQFIEKALKKFINSPLSIEELARKLDVDSELLIKWIEEHIDEKTFSDYIVLHRWKIALVFIVIALLIVSIPIFLPPPWEFLFIVLVFVYIFTIIQLFKISEKKKKQIIHHVSKGYKMKLENPTLYGSLKGSLSFSGDENTGKLSIKKDKKGLLSKK